MNRFFGKVWLYVKLALLNVAVMGMFITVSQTAPIYKSTSNQNPNAAVSVLPKTGIPNHLTISSLNIDLPVKTGSFDAKTKTWTIGPTDAYFADASVPANDSNGITLIYGHAQEPVFAKLPQLQLGAEAVVSSQTYKFYYQYVSTRQVYPNDTSIFSVEGQPKLVLQTCSGNWDTYRALYSFKLKAVEKI